MLNHYLIISLETICDKKLLEKDVNQTYEEYIEEMDYDNFIQNPFNEIICIGVGQLVIDAQKYTTGQIYSESKNEKEILEKFWKLIEYYLRKNIYPTIVGSNALQYELECIIYRTFKYIDELDDMTCKIISIFLSEEDKWEKGRPNYMNTYSKYLISLTKLFSNFKKTAVNTMALLTNSKLSIDKTLYEKYDEYYESDFNKILEVNKTKNLLHLELLLKYLKFMGIISNGIYQHFLNH